jgi:hypothetical protein
MKTFKTINHIDMIQCGDYNWEILKENDGSDVYKIQLADINDKIITCLYYVKN